ncbi:MAG: hypothetical protein U5R48_03135 [Gammaproteobacteria bacterium]|nr:hypothetical protein [Gammaproteobacteria bacterium]
MAERLLAAGESGALDREELIGLLTDLAIRLTPAQQSRLAAVVPHPELRARVRAVPGRAAARQQRGRRAWPAPTWT